MVAGNVILVPVIVAVVGNIDPPTKLGVTSVHMAKEDILDMSTFKMKWIPAAETMVYEYLLNKIF